MEQLFVYLRGLAAAAVAVALCETLAPRFGRGLMRLVGSAVLLLCLLGGSALTVTLPEGDRVEIGDLSYQVEEQVLQETRQRLQTVLNTALAEKLGETGAVLDVEAYFDGEGHIHMTTIRLEENLAVRYGETTVAAACESVLGLSVPLVFGEKTA